MSLEIAPFVSVEEVKLQIQQLKDVYGVSGEELENSSELCAEFEDAFAEYMFLKAQLNALTQIKQDEALSTVRCLYASSGSRGKCLPAVVIRDVPYKLAA